jgi:hypothetical protein
LVEFDTGDRTVTKGPETALSRPCKDIFVAALQPVIADIDALLQHF